MTNNLDAFLKMEEGILHKDMQQFSNKEFEIKDNNFENTFTIKSTLCVLARPRGSHRRNKNNIQENKFALRPMDRRKCKQPGGRPERA